mgnify:FL=1
MIRRKHERIHESKQAFGGIGTMEADRILNDADEMCGKGRLFNHVYLRKNCEVGWHVHQGDGEVYYILKGRGEYSDNGTLTTLEAGDVAFCPSGEGHSIINRDDETLEMIALILYM